MKTHLCGGSILPTIAPQGKTEGCWSALPLLPLLSPNLPPGPSGTLPCRAPVGCVSASWRQQVRLMTEVVLLPASSPEVTAEVA